jgi:hypothetical protein
MPILKNSKEVKEAEDALINLVASCGKNPLRFVKAVYPWGSDVLTGEGSDSPRDWQTSILKDVADYMKSPRKGRLPFKLSVASGHGIGKSALLSWLVHWGMSTQDDCKVVVTANTENQLRTKTWPEVIKWFQLGMNSHWFKNSAMSITSSDVRHSALWRADAIPWSEQNPNAFAGLHSKGKRVMLIFDEGSTIPESIWEVAEGALTDYDTDIFWFVFGNPTQNSGRFADCFGRYAKVWKHKQIDSRTVKGTNKELFADWVETYGEDSDFIKVRVRGVFPSAADHQLIPINDVDLCMRTEMTFLPEEPVILGVDIARYGSDQSVLYERQGRVIRTPVRWRGFDSVQSAEKIALEYKSRKADLVIVDGGNSGGGVVDVLKRIIPSSKVLEVNFGQASCKPTVYKNKRAEMWHTMAEAIKKGVQLPSEKDLREELISIEYHIDAKGLIQLEDKDLLKQRIGRSPDDADALALTFAFTPSLKRRTPEFSFGRSYQNTSGPNSWMAV